jgi:hypothetical protein
MARFVSFESDRNYNEFFYAPVTWVPAEVKSIELKQHVITAKMTLCVRECKGPGLWKTATPPLFYKSGLTSDSLPDAFKAVAAQQDKVLTLHTDRVTEVILNGMTAHLRDLKIGDTIGIDLTNGFTPDDLWAHYIRVYRF